MGEPGKIYKAIPTAMAEIEAISKDRMNAQQGFKFRGIDDVYNALHSILAKNGLFTVPEILEMSSSERESRNGGTLFLEKYKIKYTFYADDGSSIYAVVSGIGMDSGDKAGNKAMAIAHKYALLQVFSIPTEDDKDPDSQTHDVKPPVAHREAPTSPAAPRPPTHTTPAQSTPSTPPPQSPQNQAANNAGFAGDIMVSGTVKDVSVREGTTNKKKWKLYTVVVTDAAGVDHYVGTFDTNAGDEITSDIGKRVLINAYRTNKGNLAFEEYKRVDEPAPVAPEQQDKDNPLPF